MPMYYFHVREGERVTKDEEGREFTDNVAARAHAEQAIKEWLANRVLSSGAAHPSDFVKEIEVTVETDQPLFKVRFADVARELGLPHPK